MLKNIKIGHRIIFGFSLVLVVMIGVTTPVNLSKVGDIVYEAEQRELRGLFENAKAAIAAEGRLGEAMSALVANIPEVQQAMADGERDKLAEMLVPSFKVLKAEYGARQFQFHNPPATSFLRVHKPQKFGDDLSSFRKTVVKTNQARQPVQGVEKGVAGLGIRGIVPVLNGGQHIGSVEFGMSFGQPFFENFKKLNNVDIGLYIPDGSSFKTFANTLGSSALLSDEQLGSALQGKNEVTYLESNGLDLAVYAAAITDFSGKPIGVLEIAMDRSDYISATSDARNATLMIGLLILTVGILLAMFLSKGIVGPINTTVMAMQDIAEGEGDLTQRLDESGKDEISQLGRAFNHFAEKVRLLVKDVAQSTEQLNAASNGMMIITEETTIGVERQRSEIEQVATAMNEMTATVQEVARNASDAAEAAKNADHESGNGKQVVSETISTIGNLAGEVDNAADVINRLETDSESIGSVLDVIKGIAEQTNLLALNAAIEAARAGEQGRGFAVVADEVRTLASRTQESTEEIQSMIERLQTGSRDAVHVMEQGKTSAQTSVEQASKAGQSLEVITQSVSTIHDMNTLIASAAEEQSAVAEEINRNVTNINTVAEDVTINVNKTSASGNELAMLASQLQESVGQFKV